jgi:hypothetical protein
LRSSSFKISNPRISKFNFSHLSKVQCGDKCQKEKVTSKKLLIE